MVDDGRSLPWELGLRFAIWPPVIVSWTIFFVSSIIHMLWFTDRSSYTLEQRIHNQKPKNLVECEVKKRDKEKKEKEDRSWRSRNLPAQSIDELFRWFNDLISLDNCTLVIEKVLFLTLSSSMGPKSRDFSFIDGGSQWCKYNRSGFRSGSWQKSPS